MTTIRVAERRRFTTIDREAVNDNRLSFRARGLLTWLLDKPDDWETDSSKIASQTTEGRDAVRSALNELEAHGYLHRQKRQDGLGHWSTDWVIHERPTTDAGFPGVGDPDVGLPDVGDPGAITETETDTETETATDTSVSAFTDEILDLCELLAQHIGDWSPDGKRPNIGRQWLVDMDRMIRIDGREAFKIRSVIHWLFTSPDDVATFWAPNVQSPKKLRAKWTVMEAQHRRSVAKPAHQSTIQQSLNAIRERDIS